MGVLDIRYHNTDIKVELGDYVEYQPMFLFWKLKPGRISYVPGISKPHSHMEYDEVSLVGINGEDGTFRGIWVDPQTHVLKKTVRFLSRTDDTNFFTPEDIKEEDW